MHARPLSPERQRHLASRAQRGDQRARDLLVTTNRGLVAEISREYAGRGVEFDDLMQEGMLGLMRAVDKFDLTRPVRFSTYAAWWIRQGLGRICEQQGSVSRFGYRLPSHITNAMGRVSRTRQELERQLGRDATPAELAAACEISEDAAFQALRMHATPAPTSLDATVSADSDGTDQSFAEKIADDRPDAVEEIADNDRQAALRSMLARLPEAERMLLNRRYGLDGQTPATERQLTEEWGTDRAALQAARTQALRRLRRDPQVRELQDDPTPLPAALRLGVARSVMRQTCGHLQDGASPRDLHLETVSTLSERGVVGRVAGGWWMISRPENSERWQVRLLDGQDGDVLSPAQAATRMKGEQLMEASEWVARMPLQQAEECSCCGTR